MLDQQTKRLYSKVALSRGMAWTCSVNLHFTISVYLKVYKNFFSLPYDLYA